MSETQILRRPMRPVRVCTVLGLTALTGMALSVPAASAQTTSKKRVVEVVTRGPFGKMLATVAGRSLYTPPPTGCAGGCLSVWPPLDVAKGVVPTGRKGLGTVQVKVGHTVHFQVTYLGKPLFAFVGDSGSSVNGNGDGGFSVATVA